MQVYLINLAGADDRLAAATTHLSKAGLNFSRIEAVDGRGKESRSFPQYNHSNAVRFYGRGLTSGEIGCYLSHLACIERFLESDNEHCLVLEDDVVFPVDGAQTLKFLIEALQQSSASDWELVNLGRRAKVFRSKIGNAGGSAVFRAHYFPITTTALLWSRRGAEAFWATRDEISAPVDHFLRRFCCRRGGGIALDPPVVTNSGVESMIDQIAKTASNTANSATRTWHNRLHYQIAETRRQSANYVFALYGNIQFWLFGRHAHLEPLEGRENETRIIK